MAVAGVIAILFAGAAYFTHKTDQRTLEMVVSTRVPENPEKPTRWAELVSEDGSRLIVDGYARYNWLKGSEAVFDQLREGEKVTLRHHVEYWNVFGYKFVRYHQDVLTPARPR